MKDTKYIVWPKFRVSFEVKASNKYIKRCVLEGQLLKHTYYEDA
jgi:hypothetical protein